MLLKKPPPQISDDKSDFDKQLDAFVEELKELREDVLHKKILSAWIYFQIFCLWKSAFCLSYQFFWK